MFMICCVWNFFKNSLLRQLLTTDTAGISSYGSFTPNNLLLTVRSDRKKLGAAPFASNGLKPVRLDSREQVYLKIIWCE